ncbi:unnamed protein product [Allacma fusca]|uniref:Uncharacterized protein n=1 Tax=Allacma fusca TaxID=39272 RepID=A0A8J2LX65_9HEXA|nr:unnamed protein product [Allacma fusca]
MASKTGLGSCSLWGLTPALNLLTFLDDKTLIDAGNDEKGIHILLFGQCDCRHIFKTLEEHLNFRTRKIKINIFIVENNIELYARQLLFLSLASLPLEKIGLYEKTRQYVELFGNTSIRPRTQHSLVKLARRLVKMITDEDYLEKKMPFVNLSELKFVERDALVEICKYWIEFCDMRKENLTEKWDKRLRYHLGSRYDSRAGVFDWDYHMRLKDLGIDIISSVEYKNWRGKGMAFTDYDSEYSQPNVTLCSGASLTSNWKNVCYLGEIVTGPFIAYGIECDDKNFFEKSNDRNKFSAGDVTVHNLEKIFSTFGSIGTGSGENPEDGGRGDAGMNRHGQNLSDIFSVSFLPTEAAAHLHLKSHFLNKFHLMYFSSTMAQHLTPEITQVCAKDAIVIVESVRHLLELRQEHITAYNDKVQELAELAGLQKIPEGHEISHVDYLSYTMSPQSGPISDEIGRNNIVLLHHTKGQQTILQGHRNEIVSLSKHKENKYFASGDIGPRSTVIIWDILAGIPDKVLSLRSCHGSSGVASIDFAGNSPYIGLLGAERSSKQVISIWPYVSHRPVEPMCQYNIPSTLGYQHEIVFHPEKNNLFATTGNRGVAFYSWKLTEKKICSNVPKLSKSFSSRMKKFTRSIWSPENSFLLTATMGGFIIVWDVSNPSDVKESFDSDRNAVEIKRCYKIGINGLTSFTEHNGIYYIGDVTGVVHFYDMTFRLIGWTKHQKFLPVYFVAVNEIDSTGALRIFDQNSAGERLGAPKDQTILSRDFPLKLSNCDPTQESTFNRSPFECPDLFLGVADGTVYHYRGREERLNTVVHGANSIFVACDVNPVSNHLALITLKGEIHLYDVKTHIVVYRRSLFKKQTRLSSLKFHPTGSFAFIGSLDGRMFCRRGFDFKPTGSTFDNSHSSIDKIVFSEDGILMAFQDSSRAIGLYVNNPGKSLFAWTFKGKRRLHCKEVVDIMFCWDRARNSSRLFSLGADRRIIEYRIHFSSFNDVLEVLTITRVEQYAIPRTMTTINCCERRKLHICIATNNYEISIYDPDNQNIMRICRAPLHESPTNKMVNIRTDDGRDFTIFASGNKLGLAEEPFDGIPYKYMALLSHPTGIIRRSFLSRSSGTRTSDGTGQASLA